MQTYRNILHEMTLDTPVEPVEPDNDVKTYTTETSGGFGDNHYWNLVYAGGDYAVAKHSAVTASFEDDTNNWAIIKTWVNGVVINSEDIDR